MTSKMIAALAGLALAAPTIALAQDKAPAAAEAPDPLTASFVGSDGADIGSAELRPVAGGGVLIRAEIDGLPAGSWVAFHIHETGACEPEDGFKSAGGHFNPTDAAHGFLADGGPHAGDMPNQHVGADGTLRTQVLNTAVTLGDGDTGIQGRAIVIHDGQDDYESQPSGDAGSRIACAVIGAST